MKILEKLFGETANGIANIVDRFVQTKEEKHEANKEIQKLFQNFEIEIAKTLPEYKIEQDDTKVINQKIDYLKKELEKYEEQTNRRLNRLEDKVYKK